jgi:TonB family protein
MIIRDTGTPRRRVMDASASAFPLQMLISTRARRLANSMRVSRSAMVASGLFVVVFVLVILFAPRPTEEEMRIVELPKPREVVLEELKLAPPPLAEVARQMETVAIHEDAAMPVEEPPPAMTPLVPRPDRAPKLAPDAGKVGRERAREATAALDEASKSLDKALGDLDASLSTPAAAAGARPSRVRTRPTRGRGAGDLGSVDAGLVAGGSGDLSGSKVEGQQVAIGSLAAASPSLSDGAGNTGAASPDGAAAAPGVYRSNASILAVIQRYAAGIQYCYSNELKHDPSLRGKLVVAITVSASGSVTQVTVIQNSVRSSKLEACALSQIRDWKFPAIPSGVTAFQAPFVFTPPN